MSPADAQRRWSPGTGVRRQARHLPCVDVDELVRGCRRVVVVAPHPDDETLGAGGLLSTLLRRQFPIDIVMVTDGEASHAAKPGWAPDVLRSVRTLENALALRRLGWARPNVHRLQLPDSDVAAHEKVLMQRLDPLLRVGDRVLTTWQHDGHQDHEATARAVIQVAAGKRCVCAQFPVWRRSRMLLDEDVPATGRVCRFNIDGAALRRKSRALRTYRSQLTAAADGDDAPVVPPAMVDQFLVPFEVLVL